MNSIPEAKVTIFIEIGNQIKKIEIPHAHYLNIENRYNGLDTFDINFALKCEPQYDIDRNCYLTEEIRTVDESWLRNPPSQGELEADRSAKRWAEFNRAYSYDATLRADILRAGPAHPDHPNHEHEDCCK